MYKKTSFGVTVTAEPMFMNEQSSVYNSYYVWAYTISIENKSDQNVQLLHRFWKITDAYGNVEEVNGPGVVGEQPVLKPGDSYQYSSGTHLNTSSGIMQGVYQFQIIDKEEEFFEAEIPAFSLDSPYTKSAVN